MAKLSISHHERVPGHPHRWHVHLHGRSEPVAVELPADERERLDLSDDELHALVPTALERHAAERYPDAEPAEGPYRDVTPEAPVRVLQTHFMA
jgi:hypothetical protein